MQQLRKNLLAVGFVLVALILMLALDPIVGLGNTAFLIFFGVTLLSAWYGGLGSGILATLLAALFAHYFFVEPQFSLEVNFAGATRVAVFLLQGCLISVLVEALRTAQSRAVRSSRQWQQAEAELRESEANFRAMFSVTSVGHAQVDGPTRQFLQVNAAFCEMTGYSEAELLTMTVDDLNHPADRAPDQARYARLSNGTDNYYQAEKRYLRKDGSVVWVLATGNIIRSANGQALRTVAVVQDISQRKQAEIAIREGEERLQLAIEVGRMVAWEWNPLDDTLITSTNLSEIYGTPALPTGEAGLRLVHPDDRARHQAIVEQAVATRQNYQSEFRVIRPDTGAIVWLEERGDVLLNPDGSVQKLIGLTIDITMRQEAEANFQEERQIVDAIMTYIPEGITIAAAPDVTVRRVSRYGCQLVGKAAADLENISVSMHPEQWSVFHLDGVTPATGAELPLTRATQHGETITNEEWLLQPNPDRQIIISCNAGPIHDEHGTITGGVIAWRDITDRKRVDAALQQSNERFSVAMRAVDGIIFEWNLQTQMVYRSAGLFQLIGVRAEDAPPAAAWWFERVHPDDLQRIETLKPSLLDATGPDRYEGEYRIRHEAGQWVHVWERGCLQRNPQGEIISIIGFTTDITRRKQAEAERERLLQTLANERAQFEAVLQQLPEGVMIADAGSGQLILSNAQADRILKHRYHLNQELTQYEPQVPFQAYDGAGHLYAADDYPLVRSLRNGEVIIHEEMELRYRDGHRIFLDTNSAPIYDRQGQIISAVTVFQDVTDRKRTEEDLASARRQFEKIAATTPDLVYVFDLVQAANLYVNEGIKRTLGYSQAEIAAFGSSFIETLIHPDDLPGVIAGNQHFYLLGEQDVYDHELRMLHANGDYRWLRCREMVFERAPDGSVTKIIGTAQDVTEQKQAEAAREQVLAREQAAREAAEAANRLKDEFLAIVSHELRSPLNPILGWTKLLRGRQLTEQKAERALEVIERNAQMQAQLINDLLDVSRILRGKLSLENRPVHLAATIRAAIETVRLAAEAKAIDVQFTGCATPSVEPPNLQVLGDATRLQQVVWNLLSNAVKFTPAGGRVEVRLEQIGGDRGDGGDRGAESSQSTHPPASAQITVTDTGKGIAADFLPHVFDHFRQESSATTRQFGGLGLGLAIVRYLVELHGGTIQADSPGEGQGATFTVRLPLLKRPGDEALGSGGGERLSIQPSVLGHPLSNLRILVVDDDDNTREYLAFMLELHGAEVKAVATALEALSVLTRLQPNLVLSDIGMPDMDGYMLMQQIRAMPADHGTIPAIALTAYAAETDYQQAMRAGFQKHIAKPIEPQILLQAIVDLTTPPHLTL